MKLLTYCDNVSVGEMASRMSITCITVIVVLELNNTAEANRDKSKIDRVLNNDSRK